MNSVLVVCVVLLWNEFDLRIRISQTASSNRNQFYDVIGLTRSFQYLIFGLKKLLNLYWVQEEKVIFGLFVIKWIFGIKGIFVTLGRW